MLHGLRALLVGAPSQLMTVADVRAIADPLGAFLIELPQREIGAQLPQWHELLETCAAARATGAKLHLDGARLWEAAPFYERSHAEIASLFDSVYVSFYKGLNALAGAVLAGGRGFRRRGTRLATPSRRPARHDRTARANRHVAGSSEISRRCVRIAIVPWRSPSGSPRSRDSPSCRRPPQTNTFHVFLRGDKNDLERRAHDYARTHGTFVFGRLAPTVDPMLNKWEFVAGDATLDVEIDEVERAVRSVVN